MNTGILEVFGGIGLFLFGMTIMTEGLSRLTGETLRRALTSFTKTPLLGAITGALVTVLIQSSGIISVIAVGLVGARLLTFPQALGIIFGANVGSTVTGWIVALWGFTLNLRELALPLLFIGGMLRLVGNRWLSAIGFAIAGFSSVFIGISMLQSGMEAYQNILSPEIFPPDTLLGRFCLVLLGFGLTLLTQSSSAGVAAAITAVHVGTISLSQAAAMVIGMDIGTTMTALIASLGGNLNARRTGWSHVIYNLITGLVAFAILPFYFYALPRFAPRLLPEHPELALVAFHSLFNVLGLVVVLPLTSQFMRLITYLVPSSDTTWTERLDPALLKQPQVAMANVLVTLQDLSRLVFSSLTTLLSSSEQDEQAWKRLHQAVEAVEDTRDYLNRVNDPVAVQEGFQQKVTALHILDHLARLLTRIQKPQRLEGVRASAELAPSVQQLILYLTATVEDPDRMVASSQALREIYSEMNRESNRYREAAIATTVLKKAPIEALISRLDARRWLQRVTYHAQRITYYLSPKPADSAATSNLEEEESAELAPLTTPPSPVAVQASSAIFNTTSPGERP
jgi:phosphate:Na+ symporter